MKSLKIYDPAMCCSSGVCGPSVDPKLLNLAADVAFLKTKGISVERFNLGHQPEAFVNNPIVLAEMGAEAENLPIFVVDGAVKSKSLYPSRSELVSWLDLGEADDPVARPRTLLPMAEKECCSSDEAGCC